jgi:hypothetical protein
MTDVERTHIAEALLMVIFSLREDNTEKAQAWVLGIATTALARAILGSVGPRGDPEPLLEIANAQIRQQMETAQAKFHRDQLTMPPGRHNGRSKPPHA